ncbi:phage portal protein [Paeniglutamicibacter terrestris]|uniref:Phage portal protein n=1 Tax=Paeniglutamicibacter terrestris TaxID=2723403 RepID=A0ABX1G925_9MICC|nr:phage portal protein [Paeniglutamicibacter terrestris]NKG22216.1 phage portal protein [Paeniglutamicibacter terrestris]
MALTSEVQSSVDYLESQLAATSAADVLNDRYYEGSQRLEHIGLAVPPELRRFETAANWCRTTVDAVANRQKMKAFYLPGEEVASEDLMEGWDANNLGSESQILGKEKLILGRGFVSVGSNEEDPDHPLIQVESATEIVAIVNRRFRRMDAAARFYDRPAYGGPAKAATLYFPDQTLWLERGPKGWVIVDRDDHKLGRVPLVMFLNRRRVGRWQGVSEMKDVIPFVDAAARTLTNLQIAGETHSVPQKYVLGMSKEDFMDKNNNPIPAWEAYFTAIWANQNKDAKVGQFTASDLKNFHDTTNHYGQLVSGITGLPIRYFGQNSANPPTEGAIVADESRLIQNVEAKNTEDGAGWGHVMGLYERFRTGKWVEGNRIATEWYNPATPTQAQTADAVTKMYANGDGLISRESSWDELGWSEAKKKREWERIEKESRMALDSLEKQVAEVV